jgi:nucleoside triphosphate diphosphatase
MHPIERLLSIMARLRDPAGGCPWDLEQSFETIAPHTVEEAYEVDDAIRRGDLDALREELGDLLLQVVFHAQLADEAGQFTMRDVATAIVDKLERRHPHVFGTATATTSAAVVHNWQRLKDAERGAEDVPSAMATIPRALPALARAEKTAARLARLGFGWPETGAIVDKIQEEVHELRDTIDRGDHHAIARELGDVLLACASLARHTGVSAEVVLSDATERLATRAAAAERLAHQRGLSYADLDAPTQEALWDEVKRGRS